MQGYDPLPHRAVILDSALILIALTECCEDRATALNGARDIIRRTAKKDGSTIERDDPNLATQLEFLDLWEENKDEGALAVLLTPAFHYLFDVAPDTVQDLSRNEEKAVARFAVDCLDDAWEVYAVTKNVFGYDLATKFFPEVESRTSKVCNACAMQVSEQALFCRHCGAKVVMDAT